MCIRDSFWIASRRVNGDADGTRQLIDVLLLHRSHTAADVIAGIRAALTVGAVTADVVAVETRRHAAAGGATPDRHPADHVLDGEQGDRRSQRVVSLTMRRLLDPVVVIAGLPPDTRPLPSVAAYDQLLTGTDNHTDRPGGSP